jgi:hypothetical protein
VIKKIKKKNKEKNLKFFEITQGDTWRHVAPRGATLRHMAPYGAKLSPQLQSNGLRCKILKKKNITKATILFHKNSSLVLNFSLL